MKPVGRNIYAVEECGTVSREVWIKGCDLAIEEEQNHVKRTYFNQIVDVFSQNQLRSTLIKIINLTCIV